MDFSARNKKVALARWKKVFLKEQEKIPTDETSLRIKSALCGFLAGDGSVQVRRKETFSHYQIDFFPDDKKMLNAYCSFIKKLYGRKPSISVRDNVYVARLSTKSIVIDLLESSDFGLYTWSFPERLFNISGAKEIGLKAFFSAEGYVNSKYIKTQSVNLKGIIKISKLLSGFGINNNYYEYTPKNKNHSKVGMIFINQLASRKIFYEKIGFWHGRKEKFLKKTLGL